MHVTQLLHPLLGAADIEVEAISGRQSPLPKS